MKRDMETAAESLYRHLGLDPFKGNIGTGSDRLHVYVYGKWRGEKPTEWQGVPVEWHVGMGKPRACAA